MNVAQVRDIDVDKLVELYGVRPDLAHEAKAVEDASVRLTLSGKIVSGKDTVAPLVVRRLTAGPVTHLSFARPLKAEATSMIEFVEKRLDQRGSTRSAEFQDRFRLGAHEADTLLGFLVAAVEDALSSESPLPSGWSRSENVRAALQYLGSDVRRVQDHDYWVKRALPELLEALVRRESVYITDARFPNEVDAMKDAGFGVFRLLVSEETQLQRLRARDGIDPDVSRLYHISETALDHYTAFDGEVDNDHSELEWTVTTLASWFTGNSELAA